MMTKAERNLLRDELSQMQAHIARLTLRVGQLEARRTSNERLEAESPEKQAMPTYPNVPNTLALGQKTALPQGASYPYPDCPRLRSMFGFIEAHYNRPVGLNEIARRFGYSPSYLTHLVRRLSGKTLYQWIVSRRMFQARFLLLHTDFTVCEIARLVGYADTGHFVKHFRQLHEYPPKAWRELQMQ